MKTLHFLSRSEALIGFVQRLWRPGVVGSRLVSTSLARSIRIIVPMKASRKNCLKNSITIEGFRVGFQTAYRNKRVWACYFKMKLFENMEYSALLEDCMVKIFFRQQLFETVLAPKVALNLLTTLNIKLSL